ncbi:hypothetical protein [Streptomyces sp. NPDC057623]|uniref:hypothetical protein n=1 Tax=Streptomyces sp. NPDC057623 TaxID=3346187 RepID=UPI003688EC9E
MSTEARRAPIPPRPGTPPPPSLPPRPATPPRPTDPLPPDDARGGQTDTPGSLAASGAQPLPDLRVPTSEDSAPMAPPPPRASARFPDAPPSAGQAESGGPPHRHSAAQPATGGTPPRPADRPSPPRRPGAPAETAAETTFRLRPIPAAPAPGSGNPRPTTAGPTGAPARSGSGPAQGSAGLPRQQATGPARGTPGPPPQPATPPARGAVGMPPQPAARPGSAPAEPPRRPASVPLPPQRPVREPATGDGPVAPGYTGRAPAGPSRTADHSPHGHGTAAFAPDPSLSWSAPMAPGGAPGSGRPVVSFGQPEGYDEQARPRPLGGRFRPRIAAAAACVVLGLGLIGGAATGSWLIGDSGDGDAQDTFAAAGNLWHSIPVDQLFPPSVTGQGAGPGGADRVWTRIAVAPDTGCASAFDPLLRRTLAPVGCERLLRATYIDATQSYVTTVGLLFTDADAAAMRSLDTSVTKEGLDRRTDLMPRPYAPKGTLAAGFGDEQRASWTISVLTDAPVVVYAVSGWADGRTVDEPEPAEEAMRSGDTTAVAQAGLGHEAQGLADRVERALRKNVGPSTEQSS